MYIKPINIYFFFRLKKFNLGDLKIKALICKNKCLSMRIGFLPAYYYKRSMPNLCQTDRRSEFLRAHGEYACVPVSVSNIIIWLAKNYFQMLVPPQGKLTNLEAHFNLAEKLAKYMKMDSKGTEWRDLIDGLEKYIKDRGYRVNIKQQGVINNDIPESEWLMRGLIGTSNTVLSIGWYKHDIKQDKYKLIQSHCVAGAGFNNARGQLIIHDSHRASKEKPRYCTLKPITKESSFVYYGDSSSAAGFHELHGATIGEEEKIKGANKVVLEGGIVFQVYRK